MVSPQPGVPPPPPPEGRPRGVGQPPPDGVGQPPGGVGQPPGGGRQPPRGHDRPFSEPVDRRASSAGAAFRVPFSVLDAMVAIVAYLIGQLVAGVALLVVMAIAGLDPAEALDGEAALALALAAQVAGFALAILYLAARQRLTWRTLGPVRPGWLGVALTGSTGSPRRTPSANAVPPWPNGDSADHAEITIPVIRTVQKGRPSCCRRTQTRCSAPPAAA